MWPLPVPGTIEIHVANENAAMVNILSGRAWSVAAPTETGHYLGYENLPEDAADVLWVDVIHDQHGGLAASYSDTYSDLSHFSHWIGPLPLPPAPEREP